MGQIFQDVINGEIVLTSSCVNDVSFQVLEENDTDESLYIKGEIVITFDNGDSTTITKEYYDNGALSPAQQFMYDISQSWRMTGGCTNDVDASILSPNTVSTNVSSVMPTLNTQDITVSSNENLLSILKSNNESTRSLIEQQNKLLKNKNDISVESNRLRTEYIKALNKLSDVIQSQDLTSTVNNTLTVPENSINITQSTPTVNNTINVDTTDLTTANQSISTALNKLTSPSHLQKKEDYYTTSKTKNEALTDELNFNKNGDSTLKDSTDTVIKPREAKAKHSAEKAKETEDMNKTDFLTELVSFLGFGDEDDFSSQNFDKILDNDKSNPFKSIIDIASTDIAKLSTDLYKSPHLAAKYVNSKLPKDS